MTGIILVAEGLSIAVMETAEVLVSAPQAPVSAPGYALPPDAGWPGDAGETVWRYG